MSTLDTTTDLPGTYRARAASVGGLAYAAVAYLAFHVSFTWYFIGFLNNVLVPRGIDEGVPAALASAVAINVGLILLWGLQHSVMARPAFKRMWTRIIPAHTERATYVLASAIALGIVMLGWSPMPALVWEVQSGTARLAIWALQGAGWMFLVAASFEINHFELFGLEQPFRALRGESTREPAFQARYIYRVVRHPIQTGILVGMWATPEMSLGHALFATLMTAYVFVGLHFEERALVRRFGDDYRRYQREVAKLVPFTRYL